MCEATLSSAERLGSATQPMAQSSYVLLRYIGIRRVSLWSLKPWSQKMVRYLGEAFWGRLKADVEVMCMAWI